MEKISILVDAHCFDGAGQGIVSYIQGLYAELLKNPSLDITFVCSKPETVYKAFGEHAKLVQIPQSNFLYRLCFFFPKLLRSGAYQYAHFQYILPFVLSRKVKYITTIHDIIPIDFPKLYSVLYRLKVSVLFQRAAQKSDIICTVSEYSKKRIAARFNIDERKIVVTPNAVKTVFDGEQKNRVQPIARPYFLYVSRIEERKNHLLLLKAFAHTAFFKDFDVVFIGKNSSKNKSLFRFFHALSRDVQERVHFVSDISDEDLISYYQNASLFVYPSIAEGFGIPPLEAAVMGCKVVCSNSTAMSDFSFFAPYLFSPDSESELIEKIKMALSDETYPYEKIRWQISERYSWEKSASQLWNRIQVELVGGGV